ncbi:SNF2 family DNA or RNA helicase [Paenibacillus sp. V4I9]|uniref:SNF2-related protein n=1 Tax=Paenibacillus sp. V4I9 TaxID=3042308 RepID=UPI00277D98BC|nr:DEAD/DEAH box helicase [Paenibacillus sp. V4I9]MDQ0885001.1 SNF2 family DNA or RNA helicase [Paenibacillus sp. V4I9]
MEVKICYHDESSLGSLELYGQSDTLAWNRIRELIFGVQPDAELTDRTIVADWATILEIAPHLADLRKDFGFLTSYSENAKKLLLKYRDEVRSTRGAQLTQSLIISEADIPQRLKDLGFNQRTLKDYQIRDLSKMISLSHGANFSVPGAGKTTVAFAAHVLTRDDDTRLLVVAPKNAFGAWDDVIKDCLDPSLQNEWAFTRLSGGIEQISLLLKSLPKRMIIGYEQLARVRDVIARLLGRNKVHLILDESHRIKAGDKSQRGNTLLGISHLPVRRDILSGTPLPRSVDDLRPQIDFLWPGQGLGYRAVQSADANHVIRNLYVRTTKRELGLPDIIRNFIPVPMSTPQMALYSVIRQEVLKQLAGIRTNGNVDLMSSKKSVMRLLQVSANPILVIKRLTNEDPENYLYDDPKIEAIFKAIVEEYDSPKIKKACELARDLAKIREKSVIWSSFTENVERISEMLSDIGATYIHGQVATGEKNDPNTREGRIERFHNDDACMVLVANPAACSEGISLHMACHNAIYLDRSFNAAHYLQSVDRIHRLGLPEGTISNIHVLESVAPNSVGAIDFSVRRRLITKLRTMSTVLRDFDLQRLSLDEEEAEMPIDYDITIDDLADIIDELVGLAAPVSDEEVL